MLLFCHATGVLFSVTTWLNNAISYLADFRYLTFHTCAVTSSGPGLLLVSSALAQPWSHRLWSAGLDRTWFLLVIQKTYNAFPPDTWSKSCVWQGSLLAFASIICLLGGDVNFKILHLLSNKCFVIREEYSIVFLNVKLVTLQTFIFVHLYNHLVFPYRYNTVFCCTFSIIELVAQQLLSDVILSSIRNTWPCSWALNRSCCVDAYLWTRFPFQRETAQMFEFSVQILNILISFL